MEHYTANQWTPVPAPYNTTEPCGGTVSMSGWRGVQFLLERDIPQQMSTLDAKGMTYVRPKQVYLSY